MESFPEVIKAAITGLLSCNAKHSVGAIINAKSNVSNQDKVWVDRQVKSIKEKKDTNLGNVLELNKELEKFQKKIETLEKEVAEIKTSAEKKKD